MAKKRKASGKQKDSSTSNGPNLDAGPSRKRIRTFEDVADSDDEFQIQRDRVLLEEEPAAKRRRQEREREEFLEDREEEVLGYEDEEDDEEEELEEVDGAGDDNDDGSLEGLGDLAAEQEDEDEDGLAWGTTREDMYGADEIETEEQALAEEAEALRLQKKQLQNMSAADYGFDEADWRDGSPSLDATTVAVSGDQTVTEVLPPLQISDDMSADERMKLLRSRYPEFGPLSEDLIDLRREQEALLSEQGRRKEAGEMDPADAPNLTAKLRALAAYSGAIIMYFALLASPAAKARATEAASRTALSATELRGHPVIESLVTCRALWERAKAIPSDPEPIKNIQSNGFKDLEIEHTRATIPKVSKPRKKSRAERHAEAAQQAAEARRKERMQNVEDNLADLDSLVAPSSKAQGSRARQTARQQESDGEEAPLTAQEAAAKAQRKKSLRFYASQITQTANRRGAAGRNAGGDDDIPYRERLKDRQARLNAEAEKRGRKNASAADELGGASDEEDTRLARDIRGDANEDDYYNLIAGQTARKKADKAALAAARQQAAQQGGRVVVQEDEIGADGKRKITYAIEKNKGLTPHRKKEVRNPRVKKRMKFDAKKKKLASVKPVYRGGEGKGGYGGELTGIKKGLVKSTKL